MTEDTLERASEYVLAERRERVLVLTLNRPERMNAWGAALESRYLDLLAAADADPQVRAIVVTGAGRGFCAGADMEDMAQIDPGAGSGQLKSSSRPRTFALEVRKPIIAAINGSVAGIGLVQALFCDLRFCVPDAKLTTSFAHRGLPAEYGLSWILPRIVGRSRALDLLLSARVLRGTEALQLGLVDRLVEPDELLAAAVDYAQELAVRSSPWAMATIKDQVTRDLEGSFEDSVARSEALIREALDRPDIQEGVASYVERRPPVFPDLPGSPSPGDS